MARLSTEIPQSEEHRSVPARRSIGVLFGAETLRATLYDADPGPTATRPPAPRRVFGSCKGEFEIGPEFYEPLSDEELQELGVP